MSVAYAPARRRASEPVQPRTRQLEIVTTRAQRRARPKSFYAVVAVASVFALFLAQLMLSILLSDGAYQISSLQNEAKQLARTEQALGEQLDLLASPQSLATKAEALGMVVGTNAPVFLRLSDGTLAGTPTPASGVSGANAGLVPNALLVDGAETITPTESSGAPSGSTTAGSVASNTGQLPSPQTR